MKWCLLGVCILLGLASCNDKPKTLAAAPPVVIPISQPISVNLNFVGLKGQPDNTANFMGRFDQDEFKHFPLRYPVNNFAMYTKVKPADTMQFAFVSVWGEYKGELYGLQKKPEESSGTEIDINDYRLHITPRLLKPSKGMYKVVLKDKAGTVIARLDLEGKADAPKLKAGGKGFQVKRVFHDPLLRISGYEIWRAGANRDEKPLLGLQVIAEGWADSRWQQGLLPPWSKYERVFPEVDIQVLPHEWFYGKTIQDSCMRLKASAWEQAGKRLGFGGDNRDSDFIQVGDSVGLGGASPRCYG
jgi:hypothetical protein